MAEDKKTTLIGFTIAERQLLEQSLDNTIMGISNAIAKGQEKEKLRGYLKEHIKLQDKLLEAK